MRHGFAIHLKQVFIFIAIPVTIVVDGNGKLFKRLSKGMVLFGEKKKLCIGTSWPPFATSLQIMDKLRKCVEKVHTLLIINFVFSFMF